MGKALALQRATVAEARLQDALTARFASELEQVLVLLNRRIRDLLQQLDADGGRLVSTQVNIGRAIQLRGELRAALQESGFLDLSVRALDAPLDRLTSAVLTTSRIAARAAQLTPIDLNALAAFKELRLAQLLELGDDIADQVWRLTVDGVLGVRPLEHVLLDLEDVVEGSAAEARTVYDTAVSSYSRQVDQLRSTGEPDEQFLYAGPLDLKTRDFCAERVGRVFTRTDIEDMSNGQLPDVFLTGGGYNCRHAWKRVSIFDDELQALADSGDRLPELERQLAGAA